MNAEDRRRKRRKKENKRKSKKRKEEILVRNSQTLESLITGSAAEDRFSVPNPSKIRKADLTALNKKTLTPRKTLWAPKVLIREWLFPWRCKKVHSSHSTSTGSKKGTNKGLCKGLSMKKVQKPPKTNMGQKSLFDIFQAKRSEDERVVEESDNLKNAAVLHDSSEESCGDDSACSDSGGNESDCKDWKWSCSKPLWD